MKLGLAALFIAVALCGTARATDNCPTCPTTSCNPIVETYTAPDRVAHFTWRRLFFVWRRCFIESRLAGGDGSECGDRPVKPFIGTVERRRIIGCETVNN